jgi:V/A-type H+-transporting ATPase subunit A
VLRIAELFEEGFLRQSAYDANDASCSPLRQLRLLGLLLTFYHRALEAIDHGAAIRTVLSLPVVDDLVRAKSTYGDAAVAALEPLERAIGEGCASTWAVAAGTQ